MFDIVTSVLIVLAVLLGGRGTLWGPVLGAFLIEPLASLTNTGLDGANAGAIRLLLFGGLLAAVVLFLPRGLLPTVATTWSRSLTGRDSVPQPDVHAPTARRDRARMVVPTGNVLEVEGLTKTFGGVRPVDGVDLRGARASITGLIGPNGSGKTTLFNLIDGTVPTRSGRITLASNHLQRRGRAARGRAARAHAGLARTYQLPRLFPSLTVAENIVLPQRGFSLRQLCRQRITVDERPRVKAVLEDLGLAAYADTSPGELSYGQRKLIELAQVLWLDPVLVMLDEPAAGISPARSERVADMVRALCGRGVGILLVEHDLGFLASLCDHVYVMANGAVIAQGSVAQVSADAAVVDACLGDDVASRPPRPRHDHPRAPVGRIRRPGHPARSRPPGRAGWHHVHRRPERCRQVDRSQDDQWDPPTPIGIGDRRRPQPHRPVT